MSEIRHSIEREFFDTETAVEMTSDPTALVRLSPELVAEVTEGDDDPKFATFVIPSGWSKSRRYWGAELFQNVAEQINDQSEAIVGYQGHIPEDDDPYSFPDIQLQWLGAKVMQAGEQAKLAVKAYVLPNTMARNYLKRRLVRTVSWRGKIAAVPFEKGVRVKEFFIESIDLSRPRAAGLNARMVGALTSEMETGGKDVKPEEIAALQENELRAHNSGLVTAIEASVRTPLESRVGEMETAATAVKPTLDLIPDLRKALGLSEDVSDLTVMQKALESFRETGRKVRDAILDSVLDKKITDKESKDGKLLRRLIAGEMQNKDFTLTGDTAADEKTVSEMVNSLIDSDDSLKEIASEMEDSPPSVATSKPERESGKQRELKPGFSSSRIRVRQRV